MITPSLNFPLVIFTIFVRRIIGGITKDVVIKKSIWYTCSKLSQKQWPILTAGIVATCSLVQFCRSNSSTFVMGWSKTKTGVLNDIMRQKKSRSWSKEFHERKNKEAHKNSKFKLDKDCKAVNLTYQSRDSFSQTDKNQTPVKHLRDQCSYISISNSSSSLTSTNDTQCSSAIVGLRKNEQHSLWPEEYLPIKSDANFDGSNLKNKNSQLNNISFEGQNEHKTKFMDHMCEILPIRSVNFVQNHFDTNEENRNEDNKYEVNKFEDDKYEDVKYEVDKYEVDKYVDDKCEGDKYQELNKVDQSGDKEIQPTQILRTKIAQRGRNMQELRLPAKKKRLKNTLQFKPNCSDSHLIRKTRSGRVYGYSSENNFRGQKNKRRLVGKK